MKTKDFFRMEYAQILIYIVFLGLLEVLLFIFQVNYFLMIYLLLIGLILEGVYLCQRYMKKYRYYKKVKAKLDILEQKCMITEMLELPDFAEGEFLYEILKTCNKSMNDEILEYKIEAAGYREYIEMWIHEVKTPLAATRLILENHPSEITRAMDEEMQQIRQDSFIMDISRDSLYCLILTSKGRISDQIWNPLKIQLTNNVFL